METDPTYATDVRSIEEEGGLWDQDRDSVSVKMDLPADWEQTYRETERHQGHIWAEIIYPTSFSSTDDNPSPGHSSTPPAGCL